MAGTLVAQKKYFKIVYGILKGDASHYKNNLIIHLKSITMKNLKMKKVLPVALLSVALVALVAFISPVNYYELAQDNDFIRALKKKVATYNEQLPEDRIYVQFDKPMYEPGDNIWFGAYVRDGLSMKASTKSEIVHVEFLNPKGTVEKSINLIAKNGVAAGDFALDKEALGGMYKVRAYTNWMKNEGENNAFEKDVQVQDVVLPNLKMKLEFERKAFGAGDEVVAKLELNTNENKPLGDYKIRFVANLDGAQLLAKSDITDEAGIKYIKFNLPKELKTSDGLLNVMIDYNGNTESVSRSIPILLNKIKFELFPEGGDLIGGLESKVAFRAMNEFNKPADVEGIVENEKGAQVASFSSFHNGMGAFDFTPKATEKYVVRITKPEGIKETFKLPETFQRGYVLNVENNKAGEIGVNINTTETEELSLVAQVRGKIYYSTAVNVKKGTNKIIFPTSNFPIGVAQITLFDSKGIARAERLAFVNKDKQLSISVATDKEKYLPREKIKMTLTVKDERGMPMPANLSMAVVNDQLLSFADDKSGNILSQLLLQQDLKDKVEEPAFYFDTKEQKADVALDYLLMTSGWRRFTWEKMMGDKLRQVAYQNEKAIVSGIVMDAVTGKPLANAKIKVNAGADYETDENGKFIFNKLDLSSPVNLTMSKNAYTSQVQAVNGYGDNQVYYLYPTNYYNYGYYGGGMNKVAQGRPEMDEMMVNAPVAAARGANQEDLPAMEVERADEKKLEKRPMKMALAKHEGKKDKAERQPDVLAANVNFAVADVTKVKGETKEANLNLKEVAAKANDNRNERFRMEDTVAEKGKQKNINGLAEQQMAASVYYRARQFAAPVYDKQETVENRTDFRNTIYWNPNVEVDRTGTKTVEFYASDDITSFRTTVEGIASDGSIGRTEKNVFTQLPFAMSTKIPVEVATEDNVSIPLTLKNNTDKPLGGVITITSPDGLKSLAEIPSVQTIMPGKAKTIYLDYKVLDKIGYGDFTISFKSCGLGDAFTQSIKIAPKGFPVNASFSGQEVEKEYSFDMTNVVNGSLKASFTAYPNVVSDLMKGVEGILREPYGCFEQTSMSSYPNAMVLDYLKSTDSKDDKTISYAGNLLDKGYKRLITFETKDRGYEWFGSNPGHEALTAYGLMQFSDMKRAGERVDDKMVERTANWLFSRRDGDGGFKRSAEALDNFGRARKEITDAYIVYALSEAGFTDMKKEFAASYNYAMKSKDPYVLGLVACSAYNLNEKEKANEALDLLLTKQEKNGSWTGAEHSITYSTGQSLTIETSSLAVLAIIKSGNRNANALASGVKYIVGSRSGYGEFGNTQGTILALKALTEYAKASKKTNENGTVAIYVDGKKVTDKSYKAGEKDALVIDNIGQYINGEGQHTLKVKYIGVKTPLPYSVSVSWNTTLPASAKECAVNFTTKLSAKTANVGETLRMTATLTNRENKGIPSTMAIIGIPAGFTVQPWQLKEMQEKKVFDYYEISGNNIAVYYRCMAPNAVKEINLDLKAEMPGEYDAPASSAYLYYTNEYKTWSGMDRVKIVKSKI